MRDELGLVVTVRQNDQHRYAVTEENVATVRGIPQNSARVIPRLVCRDAAREVDFCVRTFDAIAVNQRRDAAGAVVHALLTLGEAMIMIESEWPEISNRAPIVDGSSPVVIFIYVSDVDAAVERAVELGAAVLSPVQDQFWGDRTAWVMDPSGHVWTVASRIEETTASERDERWDKLKRSAD
jgi:PhnB protein